MTVPGTESKSEMLEEYNQQPTRIHQLMTGYITSKAIFSGLEIGLFNALEQSDQTVATLAEHLGLALRPMRILLTALRGEHIITCDGDYYHNSTWARPFLVSSSPKYMGGFATHQNIHFNNFARLTEALLTNTSITKRVKKDGYSNEGAGAVEAREGTRRFIQALHGSALLQAEELAAKVPLPEMHQLLDLGCGSGAYSITFAQANSSLHIIARDYPAVCEVAQEYVDQAEMSGRIEFSPGDILRDTYPEGCDVVLLSHVLDGYGQEQGQHLVQRIYDYLPVGGTLLIHSHVPSRARVPFPYAFGLILLANTEEGEVHDEDVIREWITSAGAHDVTITEITPLSTLFICHK
jgi:2-polyprenyl-3-methyl-5-hydroxy-6-metoxy-1,4-benzoquinol methylase